jgi:hypothetical protein
MEEMKLMHGKMMGFPFFFFWVSVGPKGRGKGRDDGVAVNNCT